MRFQDKNSMIDITYEMPDLTPAMIQALVMLQDSYFFNSEVQHLRSSTRSRLIDANLISHDPHDNKYYFTLLGRILSFCLKEMTTITYSEDE